MQPSRHNGSRQAGQFEIARDSTIGYPTSAWIVVWQRDNREPTLAAHVF